ncbi:hypothetical protein MPER_02274, partial [Moniliophthora perniciosa FA553]
MTRNLQWTCERFAVNIHRVSKDFEEGKVVVLMRVGKKEFDFFYVLNQNPSQKSL